MRNHASHIASFFPGRLGSPGFRGEIIEKILIDAVVGLEGGSEASKRTKGAAAFLGVVVAAWHPLWG
jgi:hypothetical protein